MREEEIIMAKIKEEFEEREEGPAQPKHLKELEKVRNHQDWIAQQKEERNAARVKAELWRRYSSAAPGADREEFERAYPEILEAYRRNAAIGGDALKLDTPEYLDPDFWSR